MDGVANREGSTAAWGPLPGVDAIVAALAAARDQLGMPAAFLSEIDGDWSVVRHVDRAPGGPDIRCGDRKPRRSLYCDHVMAGRLPAFIPDTAAHSICQALPVTSAAPIGSYATAPVHRPDGSLHGMLCCVSPDPHPTLNARDLRSLRYFATVVEAQVEEELTRGLVREGAVERIEGMLSRRDFEVVYQPIISLRTGCLVSVEALSRFRIEPYRTPDVWFAEARLAGRQADLEIAAIESALSRIDALPTGVRMSVNASSDTAATGRLLGTFARAGARRVTLELTEHDPSSDPRHLIEASAAIQAAGALVALDDLGAGHSGLQQILHLSPDILKLDMGLVRGIDRDPMRRALAGAMARFAAEAGMRLIAEGIECRAEFEALRALGVDYGQGWLLGRPGSIEGAVSSTTPPRSAAAAKDRSAPRKAAVAGPSAAGPAASGPSAAAS